MTSCSLRFTDVGEVKLSPSGQAVAADVLYAPGPLSGGNVWGITLTAPGHDPRDGEMLISTFYELSGNNFYWRDASHLVLKLQCMVWRDQTSRHLGKRPRSPIHVEFQISPGCGQHENANGMPLQ